MGDRTHSVGSEEASEGVLVDSAQIDEAAAIVDSFAAQVGGVRDRPIALIARFRVRTEVSGDIVDAFAAASVKTAEEAGALAYQLHREPKDAGGFVVYERWRSLNDLEAHLRRPHITALRRKIEHAMEAQADFCVLLPA